MQILMGIIVYVTLFTSNEHSNLKGQFRVKLIPHNKENDQRHSQCIHVADGPSRHYGISYCFLELSERLRRDQTEKHIPPS